MILANRLMMNMPVLSSGDPVHKFPINGMCIGYDFTNIDNVNVLAIKEAICQDSLMFFQNNKSNKVSQLDVDVNGVLMADGIFAVIENKKSLSEYGMAIHSQSTSAVEYCFIVDFINIKQPTSTFGNVLNVGTYGYSPILKTGGRQSIQTHPNISFLDEQLNKKYRVIYNFKNGAVNCLLINQDGNIKQKNAYGHYYILSGSEEIVIGCALSGINAVSISHTRMSNFVFYNRALSNDEVEKLKEL